jgi:hypothetical protein
MPNTPLTAGDQFATDQFAVGMGALPYSGAIAPSTVYAATAPAPFEFGVLGATGFVLVVNITALTGTSITAAIEYLDTVSPAWINLGSTAALVGAGTTELTVHPYMVAVANSVIAKPLRPKLRVKMTHNTITSVTYSLGGHVTF